MKTSLLFSVLLFSIFSLAQVGVNTEHPNQMLSVNGKVEIGDDTAPPTEGTMRFNRENTQFEGYNGRNWNRLAGSNGGFPHIIAHITGLVSVHPEYGIVSLFLTDETNGLPIGAEVPADTYLLVTDIFIESSNFPGSVNDFCNISLGPVLTSGNFIDVYREHRISVSNMRNVHRITAGHSPLFIVRPGESLKVFSYFNSAHVYVKIKGFFVSDLNYN
ncbi:MAG: hypothetical protein Q4G27_09085 [Flavobacteriaceae bacterium]|nr:hypothetical protein [Flavobacteriaceae bacterium]